MNHFMSNALEWFKAKENKTMTQEEKLEKIASIQKMKLERIASFVLTYILHYERKSNGKNQLVHLLLFISSFFFYQVLLYEHKNITTNTEPLE